MKLWLDTVGRALIEFILIIALVALMGGLDSSVGPGQRDGRSVLLGSARSAIAYMPLAVAATIFLSMFAFERRVSSRAAGWLGLLTIGCLLFAAYFGLLGLSAGGSLARAAGDQAKQTQAQAPQAGLAAERGLSLIWAQDFGPGQAQAVVAADFARPYPRLRYAGTAPYDQATATVRLGGEDYAASEPLASVGPLVPEASVLPKARIWDRLAAIYPSSLARAAAAAAGFLVFLIGFRFLARSSAWPLASAALAAAGFVAAIIADSYLGSPGAERLSRDLMGSPLPFVYVVAALEGGIGLVIGAIDLLLAPRRRGEA